MPTHSDSRNFRKFDFPQYQADYIPTNIDISKLRPNESYDFLFKNRDYVLEQLLDENNGFLPQSLLEYVPCPLCNSQQNIFVMKKDGFSLVACELCTFVFVNPRLSSEAYISTYNSPNYGHIINNLALESHDYRKTRFGIERIEAIERFHSSSLEKSLLDIGSASGFFLEAASDRGWNAMGLELTESAVTFSRSRGNVVHQLTLEAASFGSGEFSVVTMFDVLEHLPDPLVSLKSIYDILRPSGLVYIYVPNWNSAARLLTGENSHFIWPTHHLSYFTPLTLSAALESSGFVIESIETHGLDIIDWLWQEKNLNGNLVDFVSDKADELQFLANAGGYGKNLRIMARKVVASS
jgi:2-polyprenyl-3-methyl-5-hydroxy-6-metoxy-1,4-benzoquinol methylase